MATNKINVVEKTPGTHIEYALSGGKKITFGDDELTINLASRERDFEVSLDICIDWHRRTCAEVRCADCYSCQTL